MQRDVYSAIADPTRRSIIHMLSEKPLNVNEVASHFDVSRTAVSKHMRILKECGLLAIEKKGRERYCHARFEALAEVALWINQYRYFWNERLDRLEDLLIQNAKKNNTKTDK